VAKRKYEDLFLSEIDPEQAKRPYAAIAFLDGTGRKPPGLSPV
jgi:hypothetical protein